MDTYYAVSSHDTPVSVMLYADSDEEAIHEVEAADREAWVGTARADVTETFWVHPHASAAEIEAALLAIGLRRVAVVRSVRVVRGGREVVETLATPWTIWADED